LGKHHEQANIPVWELGEAHFCNLQWGHRPPKFPLSMSKSLLQLISSFTDDPDRYIKPLLLWSKLLNWLRRCYDAPKWNPHFPEAVESWIRPLRLAIIITYKSPLLSPYP
jgi:hypothetical protein